MDYRDQLSDDGAVIGYSPDIRMPERTTSADKVNNESGSIIYLSDIDKFKSMPKASTGFLQAMPGHTAERLNEVAEVCTDIINDLAEEFNSAGYSRRWDAWRFIAETEAGGTKFTKEFMDTFDHASGSIIPQVMHVVINERKFLKELMDNYLELYYGKGTTAEKASEKDKALSNEIKSRSLAGNGIDFLLLAHDAELSHMVDVFTYDAENVVMNIGDCPFLKADGEISGESVAPQLEIMYRELKKEQDMRQAAYKKQHLDINDWKKASRYYASLRLDAAALYKSLCTGNIQSEFLGMKTQEFIDRLDTALEETCKPLAANTLYLQKMHDSMRRKRKLNALAVSSGYI